MAAVSVGIIDGEPRLDLAYEEDVRAGTDMNVVCTGDGSFVEVQGTAEGGLRPQDAGRAARPRGEGLRRADPAAAGRARPMSVRLLLATRNAGKARRAAAAARDAVPGVEVVGLQDVPDYPETPETGATFEENALLKAREAVAVHRLPAVADDSGLTVDALNGMPGVLSARWSGRHGDDDANTALLLGQLSPTSRRAARRGVRLRAALVTPDGTERVIERQWRGRLDRASSAEPTASATTRSSSPRGSTSPRRNSRPRRRTRAATGARPSPPWCRSSPRSWATAELGWTAQARTVEPTWARTNSATTSCTVSRSLVEDVVQVAGEGPQRRRGSMATSSWESSTGTTGSLTVEDEGRDRRPALGRGRRHLGPGPHDRRDRLARQGAPVDQRVVPQRVHVVGVGAEHLRGIG